VEIKTKKHFNELLETLAKGVLDEMTTTGDIEGYETTNAFFGSKVNTSKGRKKKKKISTNSTGFKMLESIDDSDIKKIRKLIRQVVSNIFRDLWIKRSVWKDKK
jgi:hypothetical protein